MAVKAFISFRFSDGVEIKENISRILTKSNYTINVSEDVDRSNMSDDTIKSYLYNKIADASIIIAILTGDALEYRMTNGKINDWLYDEIRYSLQDRNNNRTNALLIIYADKISDQLFHNSNHTCRMCRGKQIKTIINRKTLPMKNLMNVKTSRKKEKCDGVFDEFDDSYATFIAYSSFKYNPEKYIKCAISKRDRKDEFDIVKEI